MNDIQDWPDPTWWASRKELIEAVRTRAATHNVALQDAARLVGLEIGLEGDDLGGFVDYIWEMGQ